MRRAVERPAPWAWRCWTFRAPSADKEATSRHHHHDRSRIEGRSEGEGSKTEPPGLTPAFPFCSLTGVFSVTPEREHRQNPPPSAEGPERRSNGLWSHSRARLVACQLPDALPSSSSRTRINTTVVPNAALSISPQRRPRRRPRVSYTRTADQVHLPTRLCSHDSVHCRSRGSQRRHTPLRSSSALAGPPNPTRAVLADAPTTSPMIGDMVCGMSLPAWPFHSNRPPAPS
eukprot:scaffold125934_cov63-Phaeocystis_antarctica.AAC.2